VATIDVVSNGRINLGIGAGWKQGEYSMYGYDFPNNRTRIEQLREAVQLIKKMWTEHDVTYRGKYYRIEKMSFGPDLVQKPHPPIWIGGAGEKHALRIVAELADYSNMGEDLSMEEYAHKLAVLKKHCEAIGRDYSGIKKSLNLHVIIAKTEQEAKRRLAAEYEFQKHLFPETYHESNIGEYKKRRLVGTPEQCVSQLTDWLELEVDYFEAQSSLPAAPITMTLRFP
jgi:alkanesulfonate monooxygenase SsuD/methylene tetrahydromethanopterin reductase-like flavin-dependent oxidoreductase (luciferase family)